MGCVRVKVVLISVGILSMAMGLKLTLPLLSHFFLTQAPHVWTFFLTCFTPPYLYILLNFIILTILVTSKLHNHHLPLENTVLLPSDPVIYAGPPASVASHNCLYQTEAQTSHHTEVEGNASVQYAENTPMMATPVKATADDTVSPSLLRKDSSEFTFANENEKPPVSTRFNHRKSVRASPEGKVAALGVAKAKKQETLESTWRTITEGRAMPLTRHLKKADTWEAQGTPLRDLNGGAVMKKSETFSGREKNASTRLRKEPSLSQDELNRRVEAFINKFNTEMRLQRQESLKQYREMMNRGAH
ncbi:hypothetical protein Fmac_019064 [Flemingia macrophylla]|uniref:DUF4408 domain-containing protein n=1 Tax=Flemingia macrophylla TaxID=520843 RepID=A0ABD1M6R1_9FABA